MQADIVGVSFCIEPGHAAYLPLAHDYPGAPDQLDRKKTLAKLKPLLEDAARPKVGHHLKYDAHVLLNHGISLAGIRYDSMLESYVLNSTATRHDMDSCAKLYLGIDTIKYEDVAGKGVKQITFNQVALEQASEYAAEDADVTLQLHRVLHGELAKLPPLLKLYEEIEQPLVPVLLDMEHRGTLIDRELLRIQSGEIAKRLVELEADAHKSAGQPFNLDSPKQLQEILFNKLGLPAMRKTRTGQPSTAEDVLEELAEKYLLPRIILEYRGLAKLRSTYTEKLPGADRSEDRARAHLVSPGGRRDGPAVVQRPEPAEHPDPHARGPAHPPGLHRAEGPRAAGGRLFADRAADHGAPVGRRRPPEGIRRGG